MAVAEEKERRARAAAPRAERRVMVFMVVLVVVVVGLAVQCAGQERVGTNETFEGKGRCQGSTECTKAHPPHPPTRPAHTLEACLSPYHLHGHEYKAHNLQGNTDSKGVKSRNVVSLAKRAIGKNGKSINMGLDVWLPVAHA